MCRIVNDPYCEDAITGYPGGNIYLTWVIKNDCKKKWPRYPILRNITTS